jgi:hypothetical protein
VPNNESNCDYIAPLNPTLVAPCDGVFAGRKKNPVHFFSSTSMEVFEIQTHLITERRTTADYLLSAGQWLTPTHYGS